MTRYFKVGDNTLGTGGDDADIMAIYPGEVEELTEAEWVAASAALNAAATPAPTPPVVTSLIGNNVTHSTDAAAKKVTVTVVAPVGGNASGRPTIDGKKVSGSSGGGNFVFQAPGVMVIATHAGNNDIVIVEEF